LRVAPYPGRRFPRLTTAMETDPSFDIMLDNMAVAFDRLCISLDVPGWGFTEEMLAHKIIAVVEQGLSEPDEICDRVLRDLLH